jgi:hypothetical protein
MMDQEEFDTISVVRGYYDKVNQKIRQIKSKIYKKEGWLFVTHSYTQEELIKDDAFCTIDGIINNLSANVQEWGIRKGGYSMIFYTEYTNIRNKIDYDLKNLEDEIRDRQPTTWERIKYGVRNLFTYFISKLPNIFLKVLGLPYINDIIVKKIKDKE